jgi:hypothetical protein
MRSPMPVVALDTLGRLHAGGYGLFGCCTDCAQLYRMADPPERRVPSHFEIDIAALMAERGADCSVVRMAPVSCPRCGSLNTESRIATPK